MYGIYVFEINENGTKGVEKTITGNPKKVLSAMSEETKEYCISHNLHMNIVHNGKTVYSICESFI